MDKPLSRQQQRVLVSIVEGAGTTQRFGRWRRHTTDALQRLGLITVTHVPSPPDTYALWRVDLTPEGRRVRDKLVGAVEPFPFAPYRRRTRAESCLHDPLYPAGPWLCPLKRGHADFHRYYPVALIAFEVE
jgi:hypothetical protein